MGAAAFIMAEYVGIPYSNIIVRAILPAALYFLGIFISVHLEAKKLGLKGVSKDSLPLVRELIRKTYLLLPLVVLISLVASGSRTMAFSEAVAIVLAVVVNIPGKISQAKEKKENPAKNIFFTVSTLLKPARKAQYPSASPAPLPESSPAA